MKRLVCLLCAMLLLAGCAGEAPEKPEEPVVQTKTVYLHKSITQSQNNTSSRTEYSYNAQNLLTDVIISDGEGASLQWYLVHCDENGNPIEWSSADGTVIQYTYDAQGRSLRTETYSDDMLLTSTEHTWSGALRVSTTVKTPTQEQRTEYTYDDKGCLTRQDRYVGGVLSTYGLFELNEEGKAVRCNTFDPEGNPIAQVSYEYDLNTEKRITVDLQGTVLQTQTMTYDDHGNLLENKMVDVNGTVLTEIHEWISIEVPVNVPRASI